MRKLRFIAVASAILSVALWVILAFYFVLTNHWGIFAIAPLFIWLFFLALIANVACILVLVDGVNYRRQRRRLWNNAPGRRALTSLLIEQFTLHNFNLLFLLLLPLHILPYLFFVQAYRAYTVSSCP